MKNASKNTFYIYFVTFIGIIATCYLLYTTNDISLEAIIMIGLFAAVAESLSVSIAGRFLSVSSAIILCALISYGPLTAVMASIISIIARIKKDSSTGKIEHLFNTSHKRTFFNCAMFALSSTASASIYIFLGGQVLYSRTRELSGSISEILLIVSQQALCILAAIFTDILVNTLLMAGYFHTAGRGQLLQEWIHDFLWSFSGLLVVGLLGVILTAFYLSYGWFVVLLFFAPLFFARYTFSLYSNLRVSYMDTVKSLADAIEAKDHYTRGHSQRVQEYSALIADELKYTPKQKEVLQYAALLHDVGKIGVTETILNKPGKLDVDEFDTIKLHPEMGARIISNVKYLRECVPIIKFHHKYYDGSGYPDAGTDEKIPYESFILGVADAFDAMTSKRQYREPFTHDRAIEEIRRCAGTQFEPSVAEAFIKAMESQQTKASTALISPKRKLRSKHAANQKGSVPAEKTEPLLDSVQP